MNNFLKGIVLWATDPFGRKRVLTTHNDILNSMQETKTLAKATLEHRIHGTTAMDRAILGRPKHRRAVRR